MPPDDEPELQAAFRELHRQECSEAPPFEALRQRALRAAERPQPSERSFVLRLLLWGAPSAACAAALLLWLSGRFTAPNFPSTSGGDSVERVEQMLTSIEQQVEFDQAISFSSYPTDALLTQSRVDDPL